MLLNNEIHVVDCCFPNYCVDHIQQYISSLKYGTLIVLSSFLFVHNPICQEKYIQCFCKLIGQLYTFNQLSLIHQFCAHCQNIFLLVNGLNTAAPKVFQSQESRVLTTFLRVETDHCFQSVFLSNLLIKYINIKTFLIWVVSVRYP